MRQSGSTLTPPSPAQLLRAAAAVIVTRGLAQGNECPPDGPICGFDALKITAAALVPHDPRSARRLLILALTHVTRYLRITNIPSWNDQPGRTAAEVADTLHDVADWCEGIVPAALAEDVARWVASQPHLVRQLAAVPA